ncbi:MAG TPA: UDP-N-acetylmuramate--L-alanine ligase [Acidimicrobiaceae bacterium]|nr:UDP-N-acetylmuramate--L-alanine ligase [Actinomycetota bacterium]HBM55739.1 UDP-N-acetylmuramate--L-alanine ligase [Acidimicrobiaceae bacterium]
MAEGVLDLSVPRRVHVVGVGGAGMSAIAEVLAAMGHDVTGSDLKPSAGLERLEVLGVAVTVGHAAANLGQAELLTRSTAVPDRNPEYRAAAEAGIPVLSRADVLTAICAQRSTVAVAGTHGKTTTASMLALVLRQAGVRPSFIIGGDVNEIGTGAAWDSGDLLVVEADESDGTFVRLPRSAAVVTNVEPDHLDHHGGYRELLAAFRRFVEETGGPVIVGVDDPDGAHLVASTDAVGIGTAEGADWRITDVGEAWEGVRFTLTAPDGDRLPLSLPVPGLHNARNAACAAAISRLLGMPSDPIVEGLGNFGGVARRFEHRGSSGGVEFVDDYAHLPTEVRATIAAASSGSWRRLVAVFQPHRYSRTEALWSDFGNAFEGADRIYVTDVYPAGEVPRPGVSGQLIVDAVERAFPGTDIHYIQRREELVVALADDLVAGDLCLTMGAGDLTSVPDEVRGRLDA